LKSALLTRSQSVTQAERLELSVKSAERLELAADSPLALGITQVVSSELL
jgi:hypothetical protein